MHGSRYESWANEGSNLPAGFKDEHEPGEVFENKEYEEPKGRKNKSEEHYSQYYEEGEI
jgi:hypothetical protein